MPLDFFKQDILQLIKTLRISKWHKKPLEAKNIQVYRISGALTNSIYRITYKDDRFKPPSLLLRVYGKNVDEIIDRESELEVLIKLSLKHIGPKLLGVFTNGRFEQFLEGFVTLQKEQIRDQVISQMLGRRMKDLHYKIQLDYKDFKDNSPMCWKLIHKWLGIYEDELRQSFLDNGIKDEDTFMVEYSVFKKKIFEYRDWLFNKYHSNGFAANFKFCHNDTQYGNLLLHESFNAEDIVVDTPSVTPNVSNSDLTHLTESIKDGSIKTTSYKKDSQLVVIDFEYGGANFPAYDFANHFSEWMADYHDPEKSYYLNEKWFPSQLQQLNMIKAYVEYDFQFPSSNLKLNSNIDLSKLDADELIQLEIKKLYNESILWRASVQIYWCVWGLIQNGPIKTKDPVDGLGHTSHEKGVNSTYTITTGLSSIELNESAIDDEITSADDLFDYIKYAQQKAALAVGDLISFGILEAKDVLPEYRPLIKQVGSKLFDL